jgi:hypothetical protein
VKLVNEKVRYRSWLNRY